MLARTQLEFRCGSCGLAGMTPEVRYDEALALVRDELQLRCPKCARIVSIETPISDLMPGQGRADLLSFVRSMLE